MPFPPLVLDLQHLLVAYSLIGQMASTTSHFSFYLKNFTEIGVTAIYLLLYSSTSYKHKYHGIHFVLSVENFVLEEAVSLLQATSTNTMEYILCYG